MEKLKVIELFAGVGGFRIGLENTNKYEIIWSNQWEPEKNVQHASDIYMKNWPEDNNHSNEDIEKVPTKDIPDHDVLVGGFPCQDYSVASLLKNSQGLLGKKGVLWWSIQRILEEKKEKPNYLILENVDRLLNSPASQKGRDFGVILKSLDELGYAVEWRVINAADYGMPQRRRRIFFLGYKKNSPIYKKLKNENIANWITKTGVFASEFPINKSISHIKVDKKSKKETETPLVIKEIDFKEDLLSVSKNFNKNSKKTVFENTGVMIDGKIYTAKTLPDYKGDYVTIKDIMQKDTISDEFFISKKDMSKWTYLKGAKRKEKTTKDGFTFTWSEGAIAFPDSINKPSRTIITSEGGVSPARIKHVIKDKGNLRRLTPLELERLNMFPDNHTKGENITDSMRAFLMGNALVVGVVEKIGKSLNKIHKT